MLFAGFAAAAYDGKIMFAMRSAFVVAAVMIGAALASADASAVTIGTDLNRTASATYGCEVMPGSDMFGGRFFYPTGAASCTYLAVPAGGAEIPQATFGGGVLTSVSVRAGAATGPMQATILQATRSSYGFQCCHFAGASGVFTPAANTVTTVPVRLPMRNDINPSFGETVDYLALTVLAPGVPIPMEDLGGGSAPMASGFFPHVSEGQSRVDGAGLGGLVPLIRGEFQPTCAGRAAAGAAFGRAAAASVKPAETKNTLRAAADCVTALIAAGNRAKLRAGRARFNATCNVAFGCNGVARLQTKPGGGTTLASANVQIGAGQTAALSPRLTAKGRRLMSGKRKRKLWLNSTLSDTSGTKYVISSRVTLKR